MKKRIIIPLSEASESAKTQVVDYLRERGFAETAQQNSQQVFRRGDWWGNLTSFDMKRVRVKVRVYNKGSSLVIKYEINSLGQQLSEDDLAFFGYECQEIEAIARGQERLSPELWESYDALVKGSWKRLLLSLVPKLVVISALGSAVPFFLNRDSVTVPEPAGLSVDYVGAPDVLLVPLQGFPEALAQEMADWLSRDTGAYVMALPTESMTSAHNNSERDQYVAESYYPSMLAHAEKSWGSGTEAAVIFLTDKDIYLETADFNFVFSAHWDGISLVGTGRYGSANSAEAADDERFQLRTLKLLKRSIGIQHFHHPKASDRDQVMYAPIKGLGDLDRIDIEQW